MASNPMQRKARNSFLLGMLVMLLIAGVIIAFLFIQLMNMNRQQREAQASMVNVLVLKSDVKSGQVITNDMLTQLPVSSTLVPANATSDVNVINNYALQDVSGNPVSTNYNEETGEATLSIRIDDRDYELHQDETTGNYFINRNNQEEYIELNSVPIVAKVDMRANTVITTDLLSKADSMVQDDLRQQEYNMVILPTDLTSGDYIDIRLMLPSGQDYIVVSKKEVSLPSVDGIESSDTIWINLTEDETLHMSCAIYDAFRINGAKLYATKYTEAGMQAAATPTYPVNESVSALLESDPNLLEKAKNEIRQRYSGGNAANLRNNYINPTISGQGDQAHRKGRQRLGTGLFSHGTDRPGITLPADGALIHGRHIFGFIESSSRSVRTHEHSAGRGPRQFRPVSRTGCALPCL